MEYEFKKEIQKHFTYVISFNICICCYYTLHKRRRCLDLDRRRREIKIKKEGNYLIKANERERRRDAHSYFYNSHTRFLPLSLSARLRSLFWPSVQLFRAKFSPCTDVSLPGWQLYLCLWRRSRPAWRVNSFSLSHSHSHCASLGFLCCELC